MALLGMLLSNTINGLECSKLLSSSKDVVYTATPCTGLATPLCGPRLPCGQCTALQDVPQAQEEECQNLPGALLRHGPSLARSSGEARQTDIHIDSQTDRQTD
jgi:hypothetical protein